MPDWFNALSSSQFPGIIIGAILAMLSSLITTHSSAKLEKRRYVWNKRFEEYYSAIHTIQETRNALENIRTNLAGGDGIDKVADRNAADAFEKAFELSQATLHETTLRSRIVGAREVSNALEQISKVVNDYFLMVVGRFEKQDYRFIGKEYSKMLDQYDESTHTLLLKMEDDLRK